MMSWRSRRLQKDVEKNESVKKQKDLRNQRKTRKKKSLPRQARLSRSRFQRSMIGLQAHPL